MSETGSYTEFSVAGADGAVLHQVSSDGRYLTGTWDDGAGSHGFAFDRQTSSLSDFNLPGGVSIAQGCFGAGLVVGSLHNAPSRAFFFDLNTRVMTDVSSTDAGNRPRFRDINDMGLITGFDASTRKAFVGSQVPAAVRLSSRPCSGAVAQAGRTRCLRHAGRGSRGTMRPEVVALKALRHPVQALVAHLGLPDDEVPIQASRPSRNGAGP